MKSRHSITLALIALVTHTQAQVIQRIDGPIVANGETQIINLGNDLNNWITVNPRGNGTPLNEPGATGTYYFGFDWTIDNNGGEDGGGGFFAGLWFFEDNAERPAFGNGWASVGYQIAGPGGDVDVTPSTPYTLGQTVRIVGKIEFVADADDIVSMWVNPVLSTDENGQTGVPTVTVIRSMEFNNIRARTGGGQSTFAEILVASTFQGASTKDLGYDADTEPDGIKDGWERLFPGVMVVGINDAAGNPDNDGLTNLVEFQRDTNPGDADTDDDTLSDGQEVNVLLTNPKLIDTDSDGVRDDYETNTGDYVSPTNAGTSPLNADTDGDTHIDGLEIAFNSDPTDANSVPNGGNLAIIGSDPISYADGPIANASGGSGFDFDNTTNGNSFIGHTGIPSNWDNDSGNPQVLNGKIVTQQSGARREFNSNQVTGQVNGDGSTSSKIVYLRADVTIGADVTFTGLSSYDFGAEKVFAGVPTEPNPVSGKKEFALTGPGLDGGALEYTGVEAVVGQTYTLVVKVDYVADIASIFVNPNLAGAEPTPLKTAPWTSGNWTTALRVASGGAGTVAWDNIVAAREWSGLNAFPTGPTTTYAAWIAGFPQVGAFTGVSDDFDQDGLDNGIEQVLGTSPAAFNQGLVQVSSSGNSVVFSHSRTNTTATDIASSYEWSTNLQDWFASGATAPGGLSVLITSQTTTDLTAPANDTITVTATPTSGTSSKLFVRLKATSSF